MPLEEELQVLSAHQIRVWVLVSLQRDLVASVVHSVMVLLLRLARARVLLRDVLMVVLWITRDGLARFHTLAVAESAWHLRMQACFQAFRCLSQPRSLPRPIRLPRQPRQRRSSSAR